MFQDNTHINELFQFSEILNSIFLHLLKLGPPGPRFTKPGSKLLECNFFWRITFRVYIDLIHLHILLPVALD
jgi:hypothetical protein